jgi:hypothetical protein
LNLGQSVRQPIPKIGNAAFAGRVIPLWVALAGAELIQTGQISAGTMVLGPPNVMAAHWSAMKLARGVKRSVSALRLSLKGLQAQSVMTFSVPELIGIGIVEFTLIHGLNVVEMQLLDRWQRRSLRDHAQAKIADFHAASFHDAVTGDYPDKRHEWSGKYQAMAHSISAHGRFDQDKVFWQREEALKELEKRKEGNLLTGPMKKSRYNIERDKIDAAFREGLRSLRQAQPQERAAPVDLPLPLPKSLVGAGGQPDPERYQEQLAQRIDDQLTDDPYQVSDQTRQIVHQTLSAMRVQWEQHQRP